MRGGPFRIASGWLLKARPLPKMSKRGEQACRARIGRPPSGLRDGMNSSRRQVAAIDYMWIIWDSPWKPLLTHHSPSRKEKYSTKWKNKTTKRKTVDWIPLRLKNAKAFISLICAGYWLTACGSEKCAKLAYLEPTLSALRSDILTRCDSLPWSSA